MVLVSLVPESDEPESDEPESDEPESDEPDSGALAPGLNERVFVAPEFVLALAGNSLFTQSPVISVRGRLLAVVSAV